MTAFEACQLPVLVCALDYQDSQVDPALSIAQPQSVKSLKACKPERNLDLLAVAHTPSLPKPVCPRNIIH
jgi:hypothetical protein